MSGADMLHPHRLDLERFIYAAVGKDRNDYDVTVFSALARLNLDPWVEAEALSALGAEAASARLDALLSHFGDVPDLGDNHSAIARSLVLLLPKGRAKQAKTAGKVTATPALERSEIISSAVIWAVVAVLLLLIQMMFSGHP